MHKKILLGIVVLLCLSFSWAQDSTICKECSPLHPVFETFETSLINGVLNVNLHLKTTSALGLEGSIDWDTNNYFSLTYPQQPENRELAANSDFVLPLTLTYDAANLPYYPVEIRVYQNFTHKGVEGLSSRSVFVYFTPYNTIEVWDDFKQQTKRRKWLYGNEANAPTRKYIPKDSIPISDIPIGYEATEGEVFQYVFVEGLAYAIPMLYPDFQGYTDTSTANQKHGCPLWFEEHYQGEINNLRIFTPHVPDGMPVSASVGLGLKNARVEVWQDRQVADDHIATFFTDSEGFVVDGNNSRVVHFEKCASNNSLDIYLKIKLEDKEDKIRTKLQGE